MGFDKNPKQFGLTCLNAWGANFRSKLFGAPFGDQGLCIRRDHFRKLGGYSEIAPYGEDLLLVWKARKVGIKLNRIASTLLTSPRKYQDYGWLKLTLLFQWRYLSLRFKRKQY
jgi:GT2 family glycosyltransferase